MIANSRRKPYGHRRYLTGRRGEPNKSASPIFLLGKNGGVVMKQWKGILQRLRAQQSNQIQLFIVIPSLTLFFLSLIVRTASSAIDPTLEKKKVAEQLRQRLSEVQNDKESKITLTAQRSTPSAHQQITRDIKERAPLATILREEGLAAVVGRQNDRNLCSVALKSGVSARIVGDGAARELEEKGAPKWTLGGCSASPSSPNQCIVSDRECETGAFDPIDGSELGRTQDEILQLIPHDRRGQFSPRISHSGADIEGHARVEGKEARGTTVDLSFRVLVPGHVGDKLARQVASLTIAFEQGGVSPAEYFGTVSGDFDGQGLSFGILQWNLGSCSLQSLLEAFRRKDNGRFRAIMETDADFMEQVIEAPCDEALSLARLVMLDADGQVQEPWITHFHALGRERVFQEVQVRYMLPQVQKAYSLADEFGFHSERAVALFFDILVQNGGIPPLVRTQYEQDIQDSERSLGRALDEVERMRILANRQAEAANPKWVNTVRARKLTIVDGEGSVNGISYNLDALGIRLRDYKTGKAVSLNNGEDALRRLEHSDLRG